MAPTEACGMIQRAKSQGRGRTPKGRRRATSTVSFGRTPRSADASESQISTNPLQSLHSAGFRMMNDTPSAPGSDSPTGAFDTEHPKFIEKFPQLVRTVKTVMTPMWEGDEPVDRLVFSLSAGCIDDFREIVLLARHGEGFGAMKILRGMFERVVTARHLRANPDNCAAFIDFHYISDYKAICNAKEAGYDVDPVVLAEKKALRDSVKNVFMVPCNTKGCELTIPAFSWNRSGIVAMAR